MNISFDPSDRIKPFQSYFFSRLSEIIKDLEKSGMDIIRCDIGSPDLPPAPFIVDALYQSALHPQHHGYTLHSGTAAFRKAIASYYCNRFHVELDPATEILSLIGSKEGLFNLCQAYLNPGDIVLVPDPGYPVYEAGSRIAGAIPYAIPLLEENAYLPDLDQIPADIAQKAKLLWLNYPNNPTGAVASRQFLEEVIQFAAHNKILIAFDAPYTDVTFNGYLAPSILEIDGAKEVAVEFNSLSKTYNMAGWRLGYAAGNAQVISYLRTFKSQMDSANFSPSLDAGIAALTHDQTWIHQRNAIYQERRDIIVSALRDSGCETLNPEAAIYVWSKIPDGFASSAAFCERCLKEIGVSLTPGTVYGKYGEGYFRVSLGTSTERIQEAMDRISKWLNP